MRSIFNPNEENINKVNNIIGAIRGKDSSKAVVISAPSIFVTFIFESTLLDVSSALSLTVT